MKNLTQRQLRELLTTELKLKEPEFQLENWGKRISGLVVSPSFAGMRDSERQKKIWDSLDERLGPESTHLVGMLLAYTPEERNLKLEGQFNGNGKHRARPQTK